jgi:hypothetical protein
MCVIVTDTIQAAAPAGDVGPCLPAVHCYMAARRLAQQVLNIFCCVHSPAGV